MSVDLQLKGKSYGADPAEVLGRMLPGGVLPTGDWLDAMVARGFGWHFEVGAFTTPIVGGGNGTTLDPDEPEVAINIPAGWCIRPVRIDVQCQTPLIAADSDESEILIGVDTLFGFADAASGITIERPVNMRTDLKSGCPIRCYSAVTTAINRDDGIGGTADPSLLMELARAVKTGDVQGTPATALWGDLSLLYQPRVPPFIVGPAALYVFWGGTVATSGFAQVEFVAFPSVLVTNLM